MFSSRVTRSVDRSAPAYSRVQMNFFHDTYVPARSSKITETTKYQNHRTILLVCHPLTIPHTLHTLHTLRTIPHTLHSLHIAEERKKKVVMRNWKVNMTTPFIFLEIPKVGP